jgi:acyl carrier protein
MREIIKASMARIAGIPAERFDDGAMLGSLVPSSMALVEMVIRLQEDFRIRLVQDDLRNVKTVGDLLRVLEERIAARAA